MAGLVRLVPAILALLWCTRRKTWMPGIADRFTPSAQARLLCPGHLPQPLSRCCVFACRTDKYIGGNAKVLMQTADHIDRQAAFSVHDFRDACACSNQRFEIFSGQALLLHPELDRFNRVGRIHWIVPGFIGVD